MTVKAMEYAGWETRDQIDAVLSRFGVSDTQHARWRYEYELLIPVAQEPVPFGGSVIHYPPGYCAQLSAVAKLMKEKACVAYVGRELWLRGFLVGERYWRPWLQVAAKAFDRLRPVMIRLLDEEEGDLTLPDRLARRKPSNIIGSRIMRRCTGSGLAAVYGVVLDIATSRFDGFEARTDREERSFGKTAVIAAMDISASDEHSFCGHRLDLTRGLETMLKQLSRAFRSGSLVETSNMAPHVLFQARTDALNAMKIGLCLYEATSWIFGPQSFGLRLVAWIAKKRPEWFLPYLILGIARLRTTSNSLLSSDEIAALAIAAEKLRGDSLKIKWLGENDPRLGEVFTPKRIRAAFADVGGWNRLMVDTRAATIPIGAWPI